MIFLTLLIVANLCVGLWSHRSLGKRIQDTRDALTYILTGVTRQEGPVLAQVVAAKVQAKRPVPTPAPRALNI